MLRNDIRETCKLHSLHAIAGPGKRTRAGLVQPEL